MERIERMSNLGGYLYREVPDIGDRIRLSVSHCISYTATSKNMSKLNFIEFKYGALPRKLSRKPTQLSITKERQKSNLSSRTYQPNVEEMKWVFDKFDTNKDGKISKEEYKSALKVLGTGVAAEIEVAKAFSAVDTDGDGYIDYKEFIEMMHNMGEGINANDIQSAFRVYDLDGNGKISAEELMEVLKKMGEKCSLEACHKMIRGVDADGDGLIDMNEFMTMMTRTMKPSQNLVLTCPSKWETNP